MTSGGKLKLYTDTFSPVCRAVMWLLKSEGIPYEERTLSLRKGKMNPLSCMKFRGILQSRVDRACASAYIHRGTSK